MTAPNGPILFNSGGGSDTEASGLGPIPAVFGSGASTTSASAVVTGIDTTGVVPGDLLWVQSTSGRQFSIIATVDSGTQVTCDDVFANTESGRTWAIGGKRQTFDNADSRKLFADYANGWEIETETDQTISSALAFSVASTEVVVRGVGGLRIITQTANDECFELTGSSVRITFDTLKLQNSNATKTSASGVRLANNTMVAAKSCVFGDPTNKLLSAITRSTGNSYINLSGTIVQHTVSHGVALTFDNIEVTKCLFDSCGGAGIRVASTTLSAIKSMFRSNASSGILFWDGNSSGSQVLIVGNVFYDNANSGFDNSVWGGTQAGRIVIVEDNVFALNNSYGINYQVEPTSFRKEIANNAYFNNALGDTLNVVGEVNAIPLASDPFVDAAGGDFNIDVNSLGGQELRDALVAMPGLAGTNIAPFRQWLDPLPSGGGGASVPLIGPGGLVF